MKDSRSRVRNPARIRALASPVRQEIVVSLQALGKATIAELAESLGRPADGLYYHARALANAGLIRVAHVRGPHGRLEAVFKPLSPDRPVHIRQDPSDRRNRDAVIATASTMLRTTARQFSAGLKSGHAVMAGPGRNLRAGRGLAWLNAQELADVNRLLERLVAIISRPRKSKDARLHAITFVLTPVVEKAPRRGT